jgi:DNA-binding transcriptional ArsR family regulator
VKSPQSPGELAKTLKMPRPRLTHQLKPLLKSGAVIATGSTTTRQLSLPARSRAKEAP